MAKSGNIEDTTVEDFDRLFAGSSIVFVSFVAARAVVTQLQESSRAVWVNSGFAATAILSLALGIGANTAIFSILNAVMLRSLPVEDSQRLVPVDSPQGGGDFTNPIWEEVRDHRLGEDKSAARFSQAYGSGV